MTGAIFQFGAEVTDAGRRCWRDAERDLADKVRLSEMGRFCEKVRSRSLTEIRLNDNAIFDLICLPLQIDYGRFGLTRSRAMRSPHVFLERERLRRPEDSAVQTN